jgi:hypothetical protein
MRAALKWFIAIAAVAFAAFCIVMIITGLGTGFGSGLAADALMSLLAWRTIFVPYVEIDDGGVTIQNAVRRYQFRWSEIGHVRAGQNAMYFHCHDGRIVSTSVFQKSPAAAMFRRTARTDRAESEIRARAAGAGFEV